MILYALDKAENIISIDDINVSEETKDFTCVECQGILHARALGSKIVTPHFYHPNFNRDGLEKRECCGESYLHRISKELLAKSLLESTSFMLEWESTSVCKQKKADRKVCIRREKHSINLSAEYPIVSVERRDGRFIPDIMLKNTNGDKVYIEIFISSASSIEKRNSGHKIIEIEIGSEEDIEEIIDSKMLQDNFYGVELIGFSEVNNSFDCGGKCPHNVNDYSGSHSNTPTIKLSSIPKRGGFFPSYIKEVILDLEKVKNGMISKRALTVLNEMIPFYKEMHTPPKFDSKLPRYNEMLQKISKQEYEDNFDIYKTICEKKYFWFVRYRGDHFCIADIGLYYLAYEIVENKIVPFLKSNSFSDLSEQLQNYVNKNIEKLF